MLCFINCWTQDSNVRERIYTYTGSCKTIRKQDVICIVFTLGTRQMTDLLLLAYVMFSDWFTTASVCTLLTSCHMFWHVPFNMVHVYMG